MRLPAELNHPTLAIPKVPAIFIISGKLGLWLSLTLVIGYFLFHNLTGQLIAIFSGPLPLFSLRFMPWLILGAGLGALGLARQSIWQAMQADQSNSRAAVTGLLRRFLGLDLILSSLLILLAYPLPPAQEFLLFRIFSAVLAAFVLVFGRRAALVPSIVIAAYGVSLLTISGFSACMA